MGQFAPLGDGSQADGEWPIGPPIGVPVGVPIGHFSIALTFLILLRMPVGAQAHCFGAFRISSLAPCGG